MLEPENHNHKPSKEEDEEDDTGTGMKKKTSLQKKDMFKHSRFYSQQNNDPNNKEKLFGQSLTSNRMKQSPNLFASFRSPKVTSKNKSSKAMPKFNSIVEYNPMDVINSTDSNIIKEKEE